jgi:hypothetical protein
MNAGKNPTNGREIIAAINTTVCESEAAQVIGRLLLLLAT